MVFRTLAMLAAACLMLAGTARAQGKVELLWYSQAAFKLTTPGGKVIMIDPWTMGATRIPPELKDLARDRVRQALGTVAEPDGSIVVHAYRLVAIGERR